MIVISFIIFFLKKVKKLDGLICTPHIPTKRQLADILTLGLGAFRLQFLNLSKVGWERRTFIHQFEENWKI